MHEDNPYSPPTQPIESELDLVARARRELGRPATAIIVMASIHSVFDSLPLVNYAIMSISGARLYSGTEWLIPTFLLFCVHVFQSICGAKMVLESRWMGYVGAILVCIPFLSPFVFLGIPFGIWALVLLQQEHIRLAFEMANTAGNRAPL
jgi:hypothetical protein